MPGRTQLQLPDKHCLIKAGGGGTLTVSLREGTTTIDAIHPPPSAAENRAASAAPSAGKKGSSSAKEREKEKAEAEAALRKMDSLAAARQCLHVGDSILAVDDVAIESATQLAEVCGMHACTHARMHACTHARMHACTHTHNHARPITRSMRICMCTHGGSTGLSAPVWPLALPAFRSSSRSSRGSRCSCCSISRTSSGRAANWRVSAWSHVVATACPGHRRSMPPRPFRLVVPSDATSPFFCLADRSRPVSGTRRRAGPRHSYSLPGSAWRGWR